MSFDLIVDVLADVLMDTARLVPFLLLTYIAMEALEHAASGKTERLVAQAGKAGPLIGALLGALPQCGFSAMAATLYAGRVVTVGTLVAVILSTSDEMIPVFLAHNEAPARLLTIIALKVAVGCVVGFALDALLRLRSKKHTPLQDDKDTREALAELVHDSDGLLFDAHDASADEHHGPDPADHDHDPADHDPADHGPDPADHDHVADHHAHHHHDHSHGKLTHILRSAVLHTLEVSAYLLLVSFVFGLLIEFIGEDQLALLLSVHPVRATLLAALIGLVPNCAASVALTELFLAGTLPTGAMVAGLLVSGGMGLLMLFRTNDSLKQNLIITATVYASGVLFGLVVGASGILL